MLCVKCKLDSELSKENIVEVYNLERDPLQRKNLVKKYDFNEYERYYLAILERFLKIKSNLSLDLKERKKCTTLTKE